MVSKQPEQKSVPTEEKNKHNTAQHNTRTPGGTYQQQGNGISCGYTKAYSLQTKEYHKKIIIVAIRYCTVAPAFLAKSFPRRLRGPEPPLHPWLPGGTLLGSCLARSRNPSTKHKTARCAWINQWCGRASRSLYHINHSVSTSKY